MPHNKSLQRTRSARAAERFERTAEPLVWSLIFAAVTALATLRLQDGDGLAGGLNFFLVAWPLDTLVGREVPDVFYLIVSAVVVALIAFALVFVYRKAPDHTPHRRPLAASVLGLLLLLEIVHLITGAVPRARFGSLIPRFFLPWHLVALALTGIYVAFFPKLRQTSIGVPLYWLVMFMLSLIALFPIADAL